MRDTQIDAYESIKADLPEKRAIVLDVIRKAGEMGAALFEIAMNLGWPVHCVSGRVTELNREGYIEDSGKRIVNPRSGKRGIIWRLRNKIAGAI